MQQEDDTDERDNQALLDQGALERRDCAIDQVGSIVDGFDRHTLRQAWRDFGKPVLDVPDNGECILPEPLERDARNDLALSIHLRDSSAFVGCELDARYVLE